MSKPNLSRKIDGLFEHGKWEEARRLLQKERSRDPENHWLLTQLGVTFYEQGKYEDALELFLASLRIVPDCPLTLWNLAGAMDAMGKAADAMPIYTWLLQSNKTSREDPCWESKEWAESLKADCVYRMGACLQDLGRNQEAEDFYRQYLDLLLVGVTGTYTLEDVTSRIQHFHPHGNNGGGRNGFRKAVSRALVAAGTAPGKSARRRPRKLDVSKLVGAHADSASSPRKR